MCFLPEEATAKIEKASKRHKKGGHPYGRVPYVRFRNTL
ncbi:hypothetical protein HM1_2029 [Heliomicrobium modesticaldum Ice1]|uniref:Uncharacterized protein n=1 Tax=Heliobacterium modesticaldum (strain ATCC 51547 / Ice1) TaxID=498761 RepID=B0TG90_HELMI|nr:hypothetical protein HM1_2029 [Heliomicrobium modesticaldum Ice1]